MKKLLIAYDGSPCAEAALEDLPNAGLPTSLEVVVMSVADVWLPPSLPEATSAPRYLPPAAEKARLQAVAAVDKARAEAEAAAGKLRQNSPGWRVESCAVADSPGWGVLAKASEWKPELIVLGSHGRSTLERIFLGSVSQKVAAEAPCSVRIARPRKHPQPPPLRLLVAVDGSPDSLSAVREVASRTWPPGSVIHLVSVVDERLETAIAWPGPYAPSWIENRDTGAKEAIARILEDTARILSQAGLNVETHLLTGDPKHELLSHAHRLDAHCIFVGARGLHHGGRFTLGTLASAITGRAHCSVEIVRSV